MNDNWTKEMDALLRKLARRGDSASQIGKVITEEFRPVTRLAVCGRCFRKKIKLKGVSYSALNTATAYMPPVKPIQRRGRPTRGTHTRVSGKPAAPDKALPIDLRLDEDAAPGVPFSALTEHQCHWPKHLLGPGGPDMECCGKDVHVTYDDANKPKLHWYCFKHLLRSRQTRQPKQPPRVPDYVPAPRRRRTGGTQWDL